MRYLLVILIAAVILTGCTTSTVSSSFFTATDKGDCKSNRIDGSSSSLDPRFEWKKDSLYVRWNQYDGEEFEGYYIVREDTNTCPFYYQGGDYHEYISKKTRTVFVDDVESGDTHYYRICVRQEDREVECGSVSKVIIK